jgi:hypothetical protein
MKNNLFKSLIAAIVLTVSACGKDSVEETNTPAFIIAQSENVTIPQSITLPDNSPNMNKRVATYYAEGVQKYKAQVKAGSSPVAYEWVFVAPSAVLYDNTNKVIGTHTAGPSWQLTGGNDSLFAQAFSPAKTSPSELPNTIDWLLLMTKVGKTPTGFFANVAYVQRIVTVGGKAPATPPTSANDTVDVPYTAVYRFSTNK